MKENINWQPCSGSGVIMPYNGRLPTLNEDIESELHVVARYDQVDVHLKIITKLQDDSYSASIMYFEPAGTSPTIDIHIDDVVKINKRQICYLLFE